MTITLRPAATIALVAIVGILLGLTAGQLANAHSERASASSSDTRQVVSQLRQINSKLGATYKSTSVIGMLEDTKNAAEDSKDALGSSNYDVGSVLHNTYETCKAAKGSFSC